MAAKAKEKEYVVADKGYLFKGGKVIKTGEKVLLSAEEYENVKDLVFEADTDEAKELAALEEAEEKAKAEAFQKAEIDAKAKAEAQAQAEAKAAKK